MEDGDGKIRGAMMVILVEGRFAGEVVPFAWISSGAVDEEARKKGAGALLYFWVYQSFPLVGAMSGNVFSTPINAALGLDIPGVAMERYIALHQKQTADLCLAKDRNNILDEIDKGPVLKTSNLQTLLSQNLPADYEGLWRRVCGRHLCCVERNKAYMLWRYHQVPFVQYQFLEMRLQNRLEALAVLRFQQTPAGRVCRVVDFVSDQKCSVEAWLAIQQVTESQDAIFTDFMMIGNDQDEALRVGGFQKVSRNKILETIPHLLSPVEHRQWSNTFHLGGKLAKTNWDWRCAEAVYFTKGDSDRDWPTGFDLKKGN